MLKGLHYNLSGPSDLGSAAQEPKHPVRGIQWLLLLVVLLAAGSVSAECVSYWKRVPVTVVRGRVVNVGGQTMKGVELRLVDSSDRTRFIAKSDAKGMFSFHDVPIGDYQLRASAPHFAEASRDIRVVHNGSARSRLSIRVQLGFGFECDTNTYVKGFDKPSDLEEAYQPK